MKKIKSFQVDHTKLSEGMYISRIDGDIITYDLRFCKPNSGIVLDNSTIHTVEHMLATFTRNSEIAEDVVYFGPMGCQTGFYFLTRDTVPTEKAYEIIKDALNNTIKYDGEVFGASEIECGNYKNLDLALAKKACADYLKILVNVKKIMNYDEVNQL